MSDLFETKFHSGQVVITPGASKLLAKTGVNPLEFLERHLNCDWGIASKEDWEWNDQAVVNGTKIFSAYTLDDDSKIWIITESDRSVTTILLPDEY